MDYGKKFEQQFLSDIRKLEDFVIIRLPDQQSGYFGSRNIADFLGYKYPLFYILECKSIKGNTFPISNLTQYDNLISYSGHLGIRVGVILWMIDHDSVFYIPISTFKKLKEDGKKSFNIKYKGEEEYPHIIVPSVKKRTFLTSDYSFLRDIPEGY